MKIETIKVPDQGKARLYQFDTMTEAATLFAERGPNCRSWRDGGNSWAGGTGEETVQHLRDGDLARVAASDKILARVEGKISIDTSAFRNVAAIAGGVANVPAYLAGQPMAMRQRRRVMSDLSPVAVLIDCTVSAGFSAADYERRGAAALALVRTIGQARPVSLHVFTGLYMNRKTTLASLKIETQPLDLARAAFALCSPSILRRLMFCLGAMTCHDAGTKEGDGIYWAFKDNRWQTKDLPGFIAGQLGVTEYVAVPGSYYGDADLGAEEKAAQWVVDEANRLLAAREYA